MLDKTIMFELLQNLHIIILKGEDLMSIFTITIKASFTTKCTIIFTICTQEKELPERRYTPKLTLSAPSGDLWINECADRIYYDTIPFKTKYPSFDIGSTGH